MTTRRAGVLPSIVVLHALLASCGAVASSSATTASTSGAEASDSITNVQEQGVDEGGIVKMHGEHLVVLRRGRLFSVNLAGGAMHLVSIANAFAPGEQPADWYDEMLVHGDTIVVIGFSYRDSATEIGLFEIDARGLIAHRASYQIRSNDYYSSRNYASRLIGDRLVLYMPHRLTWDHRDGALRRPIRYPALRRVGGGWLEIAGPREVGNPGRGASPSSDDEGSVLHTVLSCDLRSEAMTCGAQGLLGSMSHSFNVSPTAVYVWMQSQHDRALVYRLPLDGSATGAQQSYGLPTDQLSFREVADRLYVLVRRTGHGDWMASAERGGGGAIALASLPLSGFLGHAPDDPDAFYTPLPEPDHRSLHNRFVGDWVLYGTGDAWSRGAGEGVVYAASWRAPGPAYRVALGHGVERIEAMGSAAVVVGRERGDLVFSSLALGDVARQGATAPVYVDRYRVPNASQGESRTHGFFFRDEGAGNGVLGLPVRGGNNHGHRWLTQGSASVLYLRVASQRFSPLGALGASELGQVDDECFASCMDWYGNSRPIFWRGRVFALLGYELVEGVERNGAIVETSRISLWPYRDRRG